MDKGKTKIWRMAGILLALIVIQSQAVYAVEFPGPLVSTDFVAANLDTIEDASQTEIRLVEVSKKGYDEGHIPGAVNIKWGSEVFGPETDHMLPGHDEMEAIMKKLGVTEDSHIIIYGGSSITHGTRFYWTLKYWKIPNVHLMDGTLAKWKAENRETTTEVPAVTKMDYSVPYPPNTKVNALLTPDVFKALANPTKHDIIDTRPAKYYNGEAYDTSKWVRTGHIPGAKNLPSPEDTNKKDGSFKTQAELKALFDKIGVKGDKPVIVYCNTGVRSSDQWFALSEILGYKNVKNYDGSMREYANRLDLPIEPDNLYEDFPKGPAQLAKDAATEAAGKGICGPTALLALMMLPLGAYRIYRKRD